MRVLNIGSKKYTQVVATDEKEFITIKDMCCVPAGTVGDVYSNKVRFYHKSKFGLAYIEYFVEDIINRPEWIKVKEKPCEKCGR